MNKIVYVPMCCDILHHGHVRILQEAAKLGDVTVGLLTDRAMANYKRLPMLPYAERKVILEQLKLVTHVVPQETADYEENLTRLKPNYFVHGTDWRTNRMKSFRDKAYEVMARFGGKVVEVEYTEGVSSTDLMKVAYRKLLPEHRLRYFRHLLQEKDYLRVLEAHSGLCAKVGEMASYLTPEGDMHTFDALWLSSLTASALKCKPDIEYVDLSSRLNTVNDILETSNKPIIYDGDTGGGVQHFRLTVKNLERIGVAAVIIEDKVGIKHNSLLGDVGDIQKQDTIEGFSEKIHAGKTAQCTDDFAIIARIESLILGASFDDALSRAKSYLDAGADGIMIHSRQNDGREILDFSAKYREFAGDRVLVVVPTNYSQVYECDLVKAGANIIIYANHLLRSSFTAMMRSATCILEHGRAWEADQEYISALDLIGLIKENEL